MSKLAEGVREAVRLFWLTREAQSKRQGRRTGTRDAGDRVAVTGGAQMGGFERLLRRLLAGVGVQADCVHSRRGVELPGWFRAEKAWDLVVVIDGCLIASIELKSHVGPSFGNNFNNRSEEALGSATDIWSAYREGAFRPSARPSLGYVMLLEEAPGSRRTVGVRQPHFDVFPEFRATSYAQRYDILLTKLLRERLYDSACLLLTDRDEGRRGEYREPNSELTFARFAESLLARALAVTGTHGES